MNDPGYVLINVNMNLRRRNDSFGLERLGMMTFNEQQLVERFDMVLNGL
jgi:hypothetical protein